MIKKKNKEMKIKFLILIQNKKTIIQMNKIKKKKRKKNKKKDKSKKNKTMKIMKMIILR